MRTSILLSLALGICIGPVWADSSLAQVGFPRSAQPPTNAAPADADMTDRTSPAADSGDEAPTVREDQAPVLWVPRGEGGAEGGLEMIVGFTLEEIKRLIDQQAQMRLGRAPPQYTIEQVNAVGSVSGELARLNLELSIDVAGEGWVRIPLGLGELALSGAAKHKGPSGSKHLLEFDSAARQYVLWLQGRSDEPHSLVLAGAAPVTTRLGRSELRLSVPPATASALDLTVPEPSASAESAEGGVVDSSAAKPDAEHTTFHLVGLESDFAIAWRAGAADVEAPTPLEATADVVARMGGAGARLQVRLAIDNGPNAEWTEATIRVPRDVRVISSDSGYSVERLADAAPEGNAADAAENAAATETALYRIRLERPAASQQAVLIELEQPFAAGTETSTLVLRAPEIVGASRQHGTISLVADEGWQVDCTAAEQVRRSDAVRPTAERPEPAAAAFDYFGASHAVTARVFPRATHTTAEPRYEVFVRPDRIEVRSQFALRVRGEKLFAFGVGLEGWSLDHIDPRTAWDEDRIVLDEGELRVPLKEPATGDLELVVVAYRDLPDDAARVDFRLPQARADMVGPAVVSIASSPNVLLTPKDDEIRGLTQKSSSREATDPEAVDASAAGATQPIEYVGATAVMRYVADLRVAAQALTVAMDTKIEFAEASARVEQQLNYTVKNEALDELRFRVPTALAGQAAMEVMVDGEKLEAGTARTEPDDGQHMLVRWPLSEKHLGTFEVSVGYTLPLAMTSATAATTVPIMLDFVAPAEGTVTSHEVQLASSPLVRPQLRDERWTAETPSAETGAGGSQELRLSSEGATQLSLAVQPVPRAEGPAVVVSKNWTQSIVWGTQLRVRSVFAITAREPMVRVYLPQAARRAEIDVRLDGEPQTVARENPDSVVIVLPGERDSAKEHVLDVTYQTDLPQTSARELAVEAPSLGEDAPVRQTYWQVILPDRQHIMSAPAGMTPEHTWQRSGWSWARVPLLSQADLEEWCGTKHYDDIPATSNAYLYSTLGAMPAIKAQMAGRSSLVLVLAGAVLAAGLLLLYARPARRVEVGFALAVLLGAAALLFPEALLPSVQAAAVGIVLVGLAMLLRWWLAWRDPAAFLTRGASSIIEIGSTRTHRRSESSGSARPSTTSQSHSDQLPSAEGTA